MSHLHNQQCVKWIHCKRDLGLPITGFNKRNSFPSPLSFHVILLPLDFCGANTGYTHITELELPWGSEAPSGCVPSSFLLAGSQGAVQGGAKTGSHNPCSARLFCGWLCDFFFFAHFM